MGSGIYTVYEPSTDSNTAGTQVYTLLMSCQYQMSKKNLFLWTESGKTTPASASTLNSTHSVVRVGYKDHPDAVIPYSYYEKSYIVQQPNDKVLIPVTRTLFRKQIVK